MAWAGVEVRRRRPYQAPSSSSSSLEAVTQFGGPEKSYDRRGRAEESREEGGRRNDSVEAAWNGFFAERRGKSLSLSPHSNGENVA